MKKILILLTALVLVGCEQKVTREAGLDGMIIRDANGKLWKLNHNFMDTYFIEEIKTNSVIH